MRWARRPPRFLGGHAAIADDAAAASHPVEVGLSSVERMVVGLINPG
jgi:hypothetical protein